MTSRPEKFATTLAGASVATADPDSFSGFQRRDEGAFMVIKRSSQSAGLRWLLVLFGLVLAVCGAGLALGGARADQPRRLLVLPAGRSGSDRRGRAVCVPPPGGHRLARRRVRAHAALGPRGSRTRLLAVIAAPGAVRRADDAGSAAGAASGVVDLEDALCAGRRALRGPARRAGPGLRAARRDPQHRRSRGSHRTRLGTAGRLAALRPHPERHAFRAVRSDRQGQRRPAGSGLDLPHRA